MLAQHICRTVLRVKCKACNSLESGRKMEQDLIVLITSATRWSQLVYFSLADTQLLVDFFLDLILRQIVLLASET